jgi:hypothetical protein
MAGYLKSMLSELMPIWMRRKAPEAGARDAVPNGPSRGSRDAATRKGAATSVEGGTEPPLVRARRGRPAPRLAGRLP